ncbi:MAG: asparagine synthase-related protein [Sphingomicrobium sp.]
MLLALEKYGPHASNLRSLDTAAFGRNLYKTVPEDEYDDQPTLLSGDRRLFVADARVDNRDELVEALRIAPRGAAASSDADLLALAWQQWQLGLTDRVLGDYALAAFDRSDRSLILLRSPLGTKSLFYHVAGQFAAFASMPVGLLALDQVPRKLDFDYAGAVVAEIMDLAPETMFVGVNRLRPGHGLRIKHGREERIWAWQPKRRPPAARKPSQWVDQFRSEFERAVTVRLRRHSGRVGSQLSAGRDSSAVTATAAMALARFGEPLFAFTGAHREGFTPPQIPRRIADESHLAAMTAAIHPNIRHIVSRQTAPSVFHYFDLLSAVHYAPLFSPTAFPWVPKINDDAVANGVTLLLVGWLGNFTISSGGAHHMRDLLREDGLAKWLATAIGRGGLSWTSWRHILKVTLGPSVPRSAFTAALRVAGRGWRTDVEAPLLRQPYRARAEALLRERWADVRPQRSFFDYRRDMLLRVDNAEKMTLVTWGIDIRDPTVDQRFVELCFSLPVDQLVSANAERPIYEAAFADRLPREVLLNRKRGYQSPDWYLAFPRHEIAAHYERYGKHPLVRELINLEHVRELLDNWPTRDFYSGPVISTYRNKLLETLSVAAFINMHFPA